MARAKKLDGSAEEQRHLDAIRSAPDDDAPRLAYAEWLRLQGDPREELISVQCEIVHAPRERMPPLLRRRDELLATHAAAWLRPLRLKPEEATFWRGMVETVALTEARDRLPERARLVERALAREPVLELFLAPKIPKRGARQAYAPKTDLSVPLGELLALPALRRLRTLRLAGVLWHRAEIDALLASPLLGALRALELPGSLPTVVYVSTCGSCSSSSPATGSAPGRWRRSPPPPTCRGSRSSTSPGTPSATPGSARSPSRHTSAASARSTSRTTGSARRATPPSRAPGCPPSTG